MYGINKLNTKCIPVLVEIYVASCGPQRFVMYSTNGHDVVENVQDDLREWNARCDLATLVIVISALAQTRKKSSCTDMFRDEPESVSDRPITHEVTQTFHPSIQNSLDRRRSGQNLASSQGRARCVDECVPTPN